LRGLGHNDEADHYTHFSYEMVALTPRCAAELGYELSEEDKAKSYIEVSAARFWLKADDLIDRLIASAKASRFAASTTHRRRTRSIATQIAMGPALFHAEVHQPSVIAFDFKDALSFEGETGPYAQYAVVRATQHFPQGGLIRRRLAKILRASRRAKNSASICQANQEVKSGNCGWLRPKPLMSWINVLRLRTGISRKARLQMAQLFNTFYHRHPILHKLMKGENASC